MMPATELGLLLAQVASAKARALSALLSPRASHQVDRDTDWCFALDPHHRSAALMTWLVSFGVVAENIRRARYP
jgi:hypothetical protein